MKRFKSRKNKSNIILNYIILNIIILNSLLIYYDKKISDKIIDIAGSKLEEISTQIIKKDIVPDNVVLNNLITIEMNKNQEILGVNIDMDYSRELMVDVVQNIQKNIDLIESGKFNTNELIKGLKVYKNNTYIEVPLMLYKNGVMMQNLGPLIPLEVDFYEYVLGNVEIEINEYGINNALMKVYLEVELEQKIYIPYKEEKFKRKYSLLLGSKVIVGKVPSFYGDTYKKTSKDLEI